MWTPVSKLLVRCSKGRGHKNSPLPDTGSSTPTQGGKIPEGGHILRGVRDWLELDCNVLEVRQGTSKTFCPPGHYSEEGVLELLRML